MTDRPPPPGRPGWRRLLGGGGGGGSAAPGPWSGPAAAATSGQSCLRSPARQCHTGSLLTEAHVPRHTAGPTDTQSSLGSTQSSARSGPVISCLHNADAQVRGSFVFRMG